AVRRHWRRSCRARSRLSVGPSLASSPAATSTRPCSRKSSAPRAAQSQTESRGFPNQSFSDSTCTLERGGQQCMAKAYSEVLRSRVANAIASGESSSSIAARLCLAPSTVIKWSKRLRETGSVATAKFGGNLRCRLEARRDYVRHQVEK